MSLATALGWVTPISARLRTPTPVDVPMLSSSAHASAGSSTGVYPDDTTSWGPPEATAAIIRVSGINFRLIHRLLSQVERILCVNGLSAGHRPWSMPLAKVLVIGAA